MTKVIEINKLSMTDQMDILQKIDADPKFAEACNKVANYLDSKCTLTCDIGEHEAYFESIKAYVKSGLIKVTLNGDVMSLNDIADHLDVKYFYVLAKYETFSTTNLAGSAVEEILKPWTEVILIGGLSYTEKYAKAKYKVTKERIAEIGKRDNKGYVYAVQAALAEAKVKKPVVKDKKPVYNKAFKN